MFSSISSNLDKLGDFILDTTIPHYRNNHRPHALKSGGLFLFLVLILVSQIAVNLFSEDGDLLGYATNITSAAIISLTNQERIGEGLSQLSENSLLSNAAALKAADMFEKDYWAHFGPDGTSPWYFFGLVGYQYAAAGENLARDFATSGGVVDAWMNSPGHRANILNSSFNEIGVAVVNGNLQSEDTTLVVQLFGKPLHQASAGSSSPVSGTTTGTPTKLSADIEVPAGNQPQDYQEEAPLSSVGLKPVVPENPSNSPIDIPALVKNTSQSQRVTILMLFSIGVLFIIDSFVIFRKRHLRNGSHSFAHASVIILLAVSSLIYGWGTIL